MRLSEAKVDLEAPGFNSGKDDSALHANLARANLMRLRGDFAEAEKVCVSVLTAYPDNAAVHTLLGDIAFSQDQAAKAVEHYEIALELDNKSPDIPRKLADARRLHDAVVMMTTAEQLGLPTKPQLPWTSIGFGVIAALALGGALVAGLAGYPRTPGQGHSVSPPIVAGPEALATRAKPTTMKDAAAPITAAEPPTTEPTTSEHPISPVQPSAPPIVASTLEDQTLLSTIQSKGVLGSHLLALSSDPRTHSVAITYSVGPEEDARKLGAELAKATLDQSGDTLSVTVRGVKDQRLAYMGDIPRSLYADTITEAWQRNNPEPDAWINHSVTNEWPYKTSDQGQKTP